jgi:methyltransferase-like protein/2-polyprenyl-3-methyl-5-hydroxy-6-metoxy-1,4-benzoquinol methylase
MSDETALTPYDQVPYPAGAYAQTHPDRLSALARLFGMSPPGLRRCRVLELACADGSNLIPMACALPESAFVGVDLSARQVKAGQETIAALGLANIELRHLDIGAVDESFGSFDYVIAHGVYSWVPREVQEKILRICSERLSAQGVAYVSYNTHPGWRMRGLLRDMMLYHSRKFADPQQQIDQARALIQWLAETLASESTPYGLLLKRELEQMQRWQDTYFRHDSLEEINEPIYFHQFIDRAERHGLQYLAEAEFSSMLASNYAAPVDETLNRLGRDIIEMEQYMDFLRNRMFRQTLLCHRSVKLNRALGPWSLAGLCVAASLQPAGAEINFGSDQVETFRRQGGSTLSTAQPIVKAALVFLNERWPQAVALSELAAQARSLVENKSAAPAREPVGVDSDSRALGAAFMTAYSKGLCELRAEPGPFVASAGERPHACPLVRLQAGRGDHVVNRRHERVTLDSFERHLLPLLDGKHDRTVLLDKLVSLGADGTLVVKVDEQPNSDPAEMRRIMTAELPKRLQRFGRAALLIG